MDSRRKLGRAVAYVRRRLLLEWFMRTTVRGLAFGALTAAALLAASRLFVWPGYAGYTAMVAVAAVFVIFAYEWRKAPSRPDSVRMLDSFGKDNVILAAETDGRREGALSDALADAAAEEVSGAMDRFRKRKGRWLEPRPLLIACFAAAVTAGLSLFPSSAQLEAQEAEEEQQIIEDLADHVTDLAEQTEDPEIEKRLSDLAEQIRSADSPEEAVRETVKLQRELSLEERLAERPPNSPGQTAGERILTPGEASAALAEMSGDAEEQLARMGRTSGAGEHASLGEKGTGPAVDEGEKDSSSSDKNGGGESGTEGKGSSSGENGNDSEGTGNEAQDGSGNRGGTQSGDGTGSDRAGEAGSGSNAGDAPGSGSKGTGQGSGDGDRNLVSTPQSPPETGDPELDAGPRKEGTSAAESLVPAEKGDVRPYAEVQGEYREAYVEHAGRLGLPEDLQKVLSDYFSSIDKRE